MHLGVLTWGFASRLGVRRSHLGVFPGKHLVGVGVAAEAILEWIRVGGLMLRRYGDRVPGSRSDFLHVDICSNIFSLTRTYFRRCMKGTNSQRTIASMWITLPSAGFLVLRSAMFASK